MSEQKKLPEKKNSLRTVKGLGNRVLTWAKGNAPEHLEKIDAAQKKINTETINNALSDAHGLNRTALELFRAAGVSHKGWFDRNSRSHISNEWFIVLKSPEGGSLNREDVVEIPDLLIQNETIPVHTLVLSTIHDEKGISSTFEVNGLKESTGEELAHNNSIDSPPVFGDSVQINIGVDGSVEVGRKNDKITGFNPITPTETNIEAFLLLVGDIVRTDDAIPMSSGMPDFD